jgi:hypothetical protein
VRAVDPRPNRKLGVPQATPRDDVPGDVLVGGHPGDLLQQLPDEQVVGVRVHAGQAPGLAGGRRIEPQLDQLGRAELPEPVVVQASRRHLRQGRERVRQVVGEAAGVVEQHPNRDPPAALARHKPWQVVADRRVQPDPPPLDLLQDRGRGERLGDTADPLQHVGPDRTAGPNVGDPGRAARHLAGIAHFRVHTRHPCAM